MSLLFSFSGRLTRARFWLVVLVATAIYCAVATLAIVYYAHATAPGADALVVAGFVFALVGWYVSMAAAMARRLHDLDCSGAWALLLIVFAAFAIVILGSIRGQPGANRFGPDPLARPEPERPGTVMPG